MWSGESDDESRDVQRAAVASRAVTCAHWGMMCTVDRSHQREIHAEPRHVSVEHYLAIFSEILYHEIEFTCVGRQIDKGAKSC